jgi:uncharacterized protein YjiS (DUF1127 family)
MPPRTNEIEMTRQQAGPLSRNTIMAVIDNTRSAYVSGRGFAPLASFVATVATWNDARQTRNALGKLSNRELEDIGLCRADIEAVATSTRQF